MKKKWLIVLVVTVLLITFAAVAYFTTGKLDEESRAYANRAIPAIVRRFELDNFLQFTNSDMREKYSDAELETMIRDYQEFGDFIQITDVQGSAQRDFTFLKGDAHNVSAEYQAMVEFSETSAMVKVKMIKSPFFGWSISEFSLYPVGMSLQARHP